MPSSFQSILFTESQNKLEPTYNVPQFFVDLNLDQVFASISKGKEEYNILPFFLMTLTDSEAIAYRHEVFQDLEVQTIRQYIESFAENMKLTRKHLAQADKLLYEHQKTSWFLDAVGIYCESVSQLASQLSNSEAKSRGLRGLQSYLARLVSSNDFISLVSETRKLNDDLSRIVYRLHLKGSRISVAIYKEEPDYSVEVLKTFDKFKQGAVKSYLVEFRELVEMNHVEAQILDLVSKLFPETFLELRSYYDRYRGFIDPVISRFDREVQFYVAYLKFIENLKLSGLSFCYPQVSDESKEVSAYETFDIALASKLVGEQSKVVCNDLYLKGAERIFVVSGPNQGGKTTFARMFGQLHYLVKLGYPVPGRDARLFMYDYIFTHFEKEEHLENLRGKLQDELVRIYEILQRMTSDSIVIVNESFASTTLKDASFLGRQVLERISQIDALAVYVTFIDELSTLNDKTVSMVSTIVPENPALRTFKIVRRRADGRAYAIAIAEKYGLTYGSLRRRISQ